MKEYFHVSRKANRASILATGLAPRLQECLEVKREPAVFLFSKLAHAQDYGFWFALHEKCDWDIWLVRVTDDVMLFRDKSKDMCSFASFFSMQAIPPDYLEIQSSLAAPLSAKDAPPYCEMA